MQKNTNNNKVNERWHTEQWQVLLKQWSISDLSIS